MDLERVDKYFFCSILNNPMTKSCDAYSFTFTLSTLDDTYNGIYPPLTTFKAGIFWSASKKKIVGKSLLLYMFDTSTTEF